MSVIGDIARANGIHIAELTPEMQSILSERKNPAGEGAAVRIGEKYYILLDPGADLHEKKFIAAHELGHILLGHLRGEPPEYAEMEANIFAAVLMAFSLICEVYPETLSRRETV